MPSNNKAMEAFATIYDYAECKLYASTLLKQNLNFIFKKLDKIPAKTLSDTEKQWLIITLVNCIVHHPQELESAYLVFIDTAIVFKQEVSIRHFQALVSIIAQPEQAKLEYYIGIFQGLYEKKQPTKDEEWLFIISDEWRNGAWQAVLNNITRKNWLLKQQTNFYGNNSMPYEKFSTASEFVKFPLSIDECKSINTSYSNMLRLEKQFEHLNKFEFTEIFQQHQIRLKQQPNNHGYQLTILALLRHAVRLITKKYPYSTQMLVLLGLLLKSEGRIAQVRTGEGKTMLLTMLVAFLSSQNKRVHWVTSSDDLALRDFAESKPLLNLLGITIACICDQYNKSTVFDQTILIGKNTDFEFMLLADLLKKPADQQLPIKKPDEIWVAVIDEVDNLLIDTASNSARLAMDADLQRPWLYRPLLEFVRLQDKDIKITADLILQLRTLLSQLQSGAYQNKVAAITDHQLEKLMYSAHLALYKYIRGEQYDVVNGEIQIVDMHNTGAVQAGMRWSGGIHECVEVKEGLEPKRESLTYAAVSHPAYFKHNYAALYGLTGTMGYQEERREVELVYGIDCFDVPHHVLSKRQTLPAQIFIDQATLWDAIYVELISIQPAKHPILILLGSINAANQFHIFLNNKGLIAQLLHDRQIINKDYIIEQAGFPGIITIATNIAARGTDIKLHGKDNPGLYLIIADYPQNLRVEEQMFGRVARQGQPGICRMMLHTDDTLISELIPDKNARIVLTQDLDFLKIISILRAEHVQKFSQDRLQRTVRDQTLFQILLAFAKQYREYLIQLDTILIDQLLQPPNVAGSNTIQKFPLIFAKLATRGRALLNQQNSGINLDWTAFIKDFKATHSACIMQQWAIFYTQLNDIAYPTEIFAEFERFMHYELTKCIDSAHQNLYNLFWIMLNPNYQSQTGQDDLKYEKARFFKQNTVSNLKFFDHNPQTTISAEDSMQVNFKSFNIQGD